MNEVTYFVYSFHTLNITKTLFPFCVDEWNKLDLSIRNSTSMSIFKNAFLKCIRPKHCPVYKIFDKTGLTFLTRLRLNLIHLREHKLHCVFYTNIRTTLFENLVEIVGNIENFSDVQLILNCIKEYNTFLK